jgi:hypothetical protein
MPILDEGVPHNAQLRGLPITTLIARIGWSCGTLVSGEPRQIIDG